MEITLPFLRRVELEGSGRIPNRPLRAREPAECVNDFETAL